MQIEDRVALVTGGARGIGRGVCLVMSECGADLAVADIDIEGAKNVEGEIAEQGRKAKAFRVDVTKRSEVEAMQGQAK